MKNAQQGLTMITLLIFMAVAVTTITATVIIILVNTSTAQKIQDATTAREIAESGAENALLRLIRNPAYTGETFTIGEGTATSTVSTSGSTYTIVSTGTLRKSVRTIQVVSQYTTSMQIISWSDIF